MPHAQRGDENESCNCSADGPHILGSSNVCVGPRTPLVVADGSKVAGVIVLEDILKPAMAERFERLRKMGLRTVMITGDNPLTAAA